MRFRNRHFLCVLSFVLVSAICVGTGILVGWGLRVRHFYGLDVDNLNPDTERTVSILSELLSVDPVGSTTVMNWILLADSCLVASTECTPVHIFFDTNILRLSGDDWDKNLTNKKPEVPIFTWFPQNLQNGITPVFRTTSVLFSRQTRNDSTLQNYPFDTYGSIVYIWAEDAETGEPVNIRRSLTYGIAVGFQASSDTSLEKGTGLIVDAISFSRSGLVISYAFIIVVGVWLITLIFLGSVMKVAFGYAQPRETFVIPIGTLFAITSLRSSMPGAPDGFGAIIDFVGILPCLAIITLTGVILFAYLVISNDEVTDIEPPILRMTRRKPTIREPKSYSQVAVNDDSQIKMTGDSQVELNKDNSRRGTRHPE